MAFKLYFVLLFFTCHIASAQLTGVRTYSVPAAAESEQILSAKKHSKGYFLVGTNDGLYTFDGIDFTPIPFEHTVKNKSVTAIGEDKNKSVWIGLQTGEVGFVKNNKLELLNAEEGHPAVAITSIATDVHGTIFFGTAGEGLYYYTNKRFFNINTDDGLSDNFIYELLSDDGYIMACTDRGVNTISLDKGKKNVKTFTSANGLPDNIVRSIYPKSNFPSNSAHRQYWLGMQDLGVGFYSPFTKQNEQLFFPGWKYGQINSLISTDNQLWAATQQKGIVTINFSDQSKTAVASVLDEAGYLKAANFIEDDEGNVWFTSGSQLIKTNGAKLQNIIPFNEDTYKQIHTILADKAGNIWVNLNNGLRKYSFNPKIGRWLYKDFIIPQINLKTDITCLYEDASGRIWAGTLGKGLIIVDPLTGRTKNITEDKILVTGSILSISGDENDIWISSLGGVVHCNISGGDKYLSPNLSFQNFNDISSIGSNYVYSVFKDSKGTVWFATDGKGIAAYKDGTFINYNEQSGLKSLVIYAVCEDKSGNMWFSTLNNGLYKFDGKKFTNINYETGLNDNTITALSVDGKNNIIAVSKKGVNVIDPATLQITYLDQNQDVDEVNNDLNCIYALDGAVYIVTSKGIMHYMPVQHSLKPKTILQQVQLFLTDVDVTATDRFAYDENNFTFSYTGISFSHPDKIRYQYKIDGFTNEWITTKDNSFNVPKLPPGKYTFRVRSSINDSFNGSEEASYSFVIKKAFWFEWWFVALVLSALIAGVYLFVKSRERAVKRWERIEKEKVQSQFETLKSQVNPHFLFNSFNTLISFIEEDPDKAVTYVEHLSDLFRKIVTYRDKDIITLKEEIDIINHYFFIQRMRFGSNLSFVNNVSSEDQLCYSIAPLTLQLLTENAVKHNAVSAETPLVIELFIQAKTLIVQNNINPKITVEKGAGMGLQNIQKRYKLLSDQEVVIERSEHKFIVQIPLLKSQA